MFWGNNIKIVPANAFVVKKCSLVEAEVCNMIITCAKMGSC